MCYHTLKRKGKERKRGEEGEKKKLCEYTQVEQTGKKKKKKKELQTISNSIPNRNLSDSDMALAILKLFYVDYQI